MRRERQTSLTRTAIVCVSVAFPGSACTSIVGVSDITFKEAGAGGDQDAGGTSPSCYQVTGSGESQECSYGHLAAPGYTCASGYDHGTCPSPGLIGCCVTTTTDNGYTATAADCYYNSTAGSAAQDACTGSGEAWQKGAPDSVE
jgi:hypothetical protein